MRRKKQGGGRRRVALGLAVPHRSCVACRRQAPRDQLLRFVRAPDGALQPDVRAIAPGRGAWTCADSACVTRAVERGAFERSFDAAVLGGAEALIRAVRAALAAPGAPASLAAAFAAGPPTGGPADFSPGRLAHPRRRA